jgi:hypothetical protein
MLKRIREEWEYYSFGCSMTDERRSVVAFAYYLLRDWTMSLVCRWKGHDWGDESYGEPDSGCMAATCKRCGYSFHTQLY